MGRASERARKCMDFRGGRAQYGDTVGRSVAAISGPYHLSIGQLSLVLVLPSFLFLRIYASRVVMSRSRLFNVEE